MIASPVPRVNRARPATPSDAAAPVTVHFAPELAAQLEAAPESHPDKPVRTEAERPAPGRQPYAFD